MIKSNAGGVGRARPTHINDPPKLYSETTGEPYQIVQSELHWDSIGCATRGDGGKNTDREIN